MKYNWRPPGQPDLPKQGDAAEPQQPEPDPSPPSPVPEPEQVDPDYDPYTSHEPAVAPDESPSRWIVIGWPSFTSLIRVEDVMSVLSPEQIFSAYGLRARKAGSSYRLTYCPACRSKTEREAVAVGYRDGKWLWTHHGETCRGDLLSLVAACEGWDKHTDFVRTLERAAGVAGVTAGHVPAAINWAATFAADEAYKAELRRTMPDTWNDLPSSSVSGERYLRSRGLDPNALRDIVRYDWRSFPGLVLRALDDERVVGIQYRDIDGGELKTPMRPGSTSIGAAFIGKLSDIQPGGTAVVVEGFADALTARMIFPGCIVFGAAGAGQVEPLGATVAARVHTLGGRMLIVPHHDVKGTGQRATQRAVDHAVTTGLVLGETIIVVDVRPSKDLNEAWCAGLKYSGLLGK